MPPRRAKILLLVTSLALSLGGLELALHLAPELLPRSYLARFPGHGTEFFRPDVFERTPVEGVLLPHLATSRIGPPPADLIELGIAPPDADEDRRAFPRVTIPADELGFVNEVLPWHAELALIGDSFGVACGVREPAGLQARLEERTGLTVFNASVAGVGPAQELWLLETQVLPRAPRVVLWLFFGGNDLTADHEAWLARRDGHATWAEAWPERRRPRWLLPDLVRASLARRPPPPCPAPLPPFELELVDGGARRQWFAPDQLEALGWDEATWRAYPAFEPARTTLLAARDACRAAGAKLFLVYLPSAPEVLLPLTRPDPALFVRALEATGAQAPTEPAEALLARALANRHALEAVLRAACAEAEIPFFSAVPALTAAAAEGQQAYLVTDTHWTAVGQGALLEPLLEFLRSEGGL